MTAFPSWTNSSRRSSLAFPDASKLFPVAAKHCYRIQLRSVVLGSEGDQKAFFIEIIDEFFHDSRVISSRNQFE